MPSSYRYVFRKMIVMFEGATGNAEKMKKERSNLRFYAQITKLLC